MSEFERIFIHFPEYNVIVYQTYRYAVIPDQAEYHIRVYYPALSIQQRRGVILAIKEIPGLARLKEEI